MPMMLRNSERAAFKKCRHRWQWTYLEGRQAIEAGKALRFGDLVHRSLEPYYKKGRRRGPHPATTFERLYHEEAKALGEQGFDVFSDDKWESALDLGIGMLNGYVDKYAEHDKEFEVIASEQTFQLPVTVRENPLTGERLKRPFTFIVVGTFDGVWRRLSTKRLLFKEFKTATAINLDGLALDEQAGLYWTYGPKALRLAKLLGPKQLPGEIMYTFLRKAIPDPDAHYNEYGHKLNKPSKEALLNDFADRGKVPKSKLVDDMIAEIGDRAWLLGEVSKVQPSAYFERTPVYRDQTDRERVHARVVAEALDILAARDGKLPLYKNPGPLHMPNCRGCDVRDACEVHETGGDWAPVLAMTMTDWNPYAAHELPERV